MATSSLDHTVRIWTNSLSENFPSHALRSHNACVRSLAFSSDSKLLISGSDDKTVKLFNVYFLSIKKKAFSKKFVRSFVGHKNWVRSVRFSLSNETIASGSDDRWLKIWDSETGKVLQQFQEHTGVINAVRYLPDNNCVASSSEDKSVRIYDVRCSQLLQLYHAASSGVNDISFHPSGIFFMKTTKIGYYMLSTANDSKVKIWDLRQGKALFTLYAHEGTVNACDFSFVGDYFATGGADKSINIWQSNFLQSGSTENKLHESSVQQQSK